MKILVESSRDFEQMKEVPSVLIEEAIRLSLEQEGILQPCEINLFLVDNDEIREVNLEHRNIDKPTDVLSFPLTEMVMGYLEEPELDVNPQTGDLMLGDILISVPKAEEQAREYGHGFLRELLFLVTHGMYHLMGYDHGTEEDEKLMIGKQEQVLEKMGFLRG